MYIGDTQDSSGLHHMIFEVQTIQLMNHWQVIVQRSLSFKADNSVIISDNKRIPVDIHSEDEETVLALIVMTELHAGGKFDQDSYKVSGAYMG